MSKQKPAEYWFKKLELWRILHSTREAGRYDILLRCKGCIYCDTEDPIRCVLSQNQAAKTVRLYISSDLKKAKYLRTDALSTSQKGDYFYCMEWVRHV